MSFFRELQRRNVGRIAAAYAVAGWLVAQVADLVLGNFAAPSWVMRYLLILLAVGFPVALVVAWAYEVTPDGVRRDGGAEGSSSGSATYSGRLNRLTIAGLVLAVLLLLVDRAFLPDRIRNDDRTGVAKNSVAVLPFQALSSGEDDQYFADGLTEEILNGLAQLPELRVTARASVFHFRDRKLPLQEIAASLGVSHIVDGSVRRDGDNIRVSTQLIQAQSGTQLWSESYNRDLSDTFEVQQDIARNLATSLDVLLDEEKMNLMASVGTRNPRAFTLFQKAFNVFEDAHVDSDIVAKLADLNVLLDEIQVLAPNLVGVHTLKADYYTHLLMQQDLTDQEVANAIDVMRAEYDAAIEKFPELRQSANLRFDKAIVMGDWYSLKSKAETVLGLADSCGLTNWLITMPWFVDQDKVLKYYASSGQCDPYNEFAWSTQVALLNAIGRFEASVAVAKEGASKAPSRRLSVGYANSLMALGRSAEGIAVYDEALARPSSRYVPRLFVASLAGDAEEVAVYLDEHMATIEENGTLNLLYLARAGRRESANDVAAEIDARPLGYLQLAQHITSCMCGAPFDLEAIPNFAEKIENSDIDWPPESPLTWPLKNW